MVAMPLVIEACRNMSVLENTSTLKPAFGDDRVAQPAKQSNSSVANGNSPLLVFIRFVGSSHITFVCPGMAVG